LLTWGSLKRRPAEVAMPTQEYYIGHVVSLT
jgi:hypothetical protein